jgi:hypothetical protein
MNHSAVALAAAAAAVEAAGRAAERAFAPAAAAAAGRAAEGLRAAAGPAAGGAAAGPAGRCLKRLRVGVRLDRDSLGCTPLHCACYVGDAEAAMSIVAADGSMLSAVAFDGCTPLHYACWGGSAHLVMHLLSLGAAADAVDALGRSPLMWACRAGHLETVRLLCVACEGRVCVSRVDKFGHSAFGIASDMNHLGVARYIEQSGAIPPFERLCEPDAAEDALLRRAHPWDAVDGWSPLHFAFHSGDVGRARFVAGFYRTDDSVRALLGALPRGMGRRFGHLFLRIPKSKRHAFCRSVEKGEWPEPLASAFRKFFGPVLVTLAARGYEWAM